MRVESQRIQLNLFQHCTHVTRWSASTQRMHHGMRHAFASGTLPTRHGCAEAFLHGVGADAVLLLACATMWAWKCQAACAAERPTCRGCRPLLPVPQKARRQQASHGGRQSGPLSSCCSCSASPISCLFLSKRRSNSSEGQKAGKEVSCSVLIADTACRPCVQMRCPAGAVALLNRQQHTSPCICP